MQYVLTQTTQFIIVEVPVPVFLGMMGKDFAQYGSGYHYGEIHGGQTAKQEVEEGKQRTADLGGPAEQREQRSGAQEHPAGQHAMEEQDGNHPVRPGGSARAKLEAIAWLNNCGRKATGTMAQKRQSGRKAKKAATSTPPAITADPTPQIQDAVHSANNAGNSYGSSTKKRKQFMAACLLLLMATGPFAYGLKTTQLILQPKGRTAVKQVITYTDRLEEEFQKYSGQGGQWFSPTLTRIEKRRQHLEGMRQLRHLRDWDPHTPEEGSKRTRKKGTQIT